MVDPKALRSILLHALVGAVGGLGLLLTGWVGAHPDPQTWVLKDFGAAAFVALVAFLKKLIAGELLG